MPSAFDPSQQFEDINSKLVTSFEKFSEVFRVLLWNTGKEYGLSPIQLQLLVFIKYHPEEEHRKVAYLAGEFNMSKATISDSVKTLEEKKLVRKKTAMDDARSVNISLTAKGEKMCDRVENYTASLETAITNRTEKEKEALLLTSMHLLHELQTTAVLTPQRMCFNCQHYEGKRDATNANCNLYKMKLYTKTLRLDCPGFALEEA